MTDILLAPRLEDSTSDTEPVVSTRWQYRVRPGKDYVNGSGDEVLAEWPDGGGWKSFPGAAVTLKLDPLPADNAYYLEIKGPADTTSSTNRRIVHRNEYRQVLAGTAGGTSWYNLTRVSGVGPDATVYGLAGYDQLVAQIAALQTQINSIVVSGGGASNLAGISDMSANARTFNAAANYLAMRSALSVLPINDPTATGTATVNNLVVSGTTSFVDGSIAQADVNGLVAALAGKVGATGSTLTNVTLAGTVTVADGALAIADTNGLQGALDGKQALPSSITADGALGARWTFKPNSIGSARPAVPAWVFLEWLIDVDTYPTNINWGAGDYVTRIPG